MLTGGKNSIVATHGNGGGGFRFDLAKPLFPSNINFLNPTLPGFNSNKTKTNIFSKENSIGIFLNSHFIRGSSSGTSGSNQFKAFCRAT